ncbi:MAG: hypothetical protein QOG72_2421 [Sphingomonadales bacterium]|jgi:hypothetical protein|nr:hypothetical protein [Sphingomonadales bacterium]
MSEKKPDFAPPQGRRPSIEWVPLAELSIDPAYQRSIENSASRRLIAVIARGWNWDLCMTIAVSRRPDDSLFVVDGQHRLAAARLRGDIDAMPCCITRRASAADEATLFIAANRARRPINALEDFHAAQAAGEEEAVAIATMVSHAGLRLAREKAVKWYAAGELAHVRGLRAAYRNFGARVLAAALETIGTAFADQVIDNSGALLGALLKIHAQPPQPFRQAVLAETLAGASPAKWSVRAQLHLLTGGQQRIDALKGVILAAYGVNAREAA